MLTIIVGSCVADEDFFKAASGEKVIIELPDEPKKDMPTLYPILDTKVGEHGRYGFKNSENRWVIKPTYENTGLVRLKNGYYLVGKIGKDGTTEYIFLDKYGENAIGKTFQKAKDFSAGIAMVLENGRTRIINRAGKVVDEVNEQDDLKLNKDLTLDGRLLIASGKENIEDEKAKTKIRDIWTGKTFYEGTFHYALNVEGRYIVVDDVMNQTTYLYGYNGNLKSIRGYYVLRPGFEEIVMAPYKRKDPRAGDLYVYSLKTNAITPFPEWKTYGDKAVLEKILEFENNKKLYVYMVNTETNILMLYKEPIKNNEKEKASGDVLGYFSEGLAPLKDEIRGFRSCYYINNFGDYVFNSAVNGYLQNAFEFVNGYALVQLGARHEGKYYNDKWCYVDKQGHIKIREDIGYIQKESGQWFIE
jgi:hypothetical protein